LSIQGVEVGEIVLSEKSKIDFLELQVALLTQRVDRLCKEVAILKVLKEKKAHSERY
jgi:hypothetical protein